MRDDSLSRVMFNIKKKEFTENWYIHVRLIQIEMKGIAKSRFIIAHQVYATLSWFF